MNPDVITPAKIRLIMNDNHTKPKHTKEVGPVLDNTEILVALGGGFIGWIFCIPFVAAIFYLTPRMEQASFFGFLRSMFGFAIVVGFCKLGSFVAKRRYRSRSWST